MPREHCGANPKIFSTDCWLRATTARTVGGTSAGGGGTGVIEV